MTIDVQRAEQGIGELKARIAQQREEIAGLEQKADSERLRAARERLQQMQAAFAQMCGDGAASDQQQDLEPLDEASLELVMRDCPL